MESVPEPTSGESAPVDVRALTEFQVRQTGPIVFPIHLQYTAHYIQHIRCGVEDVGSVGCRPGCAGSGGEGEQRRTVGGKEINMRDEGEGEGEGEGYYSGWPLRESQIPASARDCATRTLDRKHPLQSGMFIRF